MITNLSTIIDACIAINQNLFSEMRSIAANLVSSEHCMSEFLTTTIKIGRRTGHTTAIARHAVDHTSAVKINAQDCLSVIILRDDAAIDIMRERIEVPNRRICLVNLREIMDISDEHLRCLRGRDLTDLNIMVYMDLASMSGKSVKKNIYAKFNEAFRLCKEINFVFLG